MSPWAFLFTGGLLLAAALGAYLVLTRERPEPRHALPEGSPRHARRLDGIPVADVREASDPDGEAWLAALRREGLPERAEYPRPDAAARSGSAVPPLPAPVRPEAPVSPLAALVREHDGLPVAGYLAPLLPPDPPPAVTGELPVAVCELGMPPEEYVSRLFPKSPAEMVADIERECAAAARQDEEREESAA